MGFHVKFKISTEGVAGGLCEVSKFTAEEPMACIVGRAADCTIRISHDDKRISRHHCLIEVNPPLLTVEDLGSSNGTLLNRHDISGRDGPALIENGDEIRIGATILEVEVKGFAPEYRKTFSPAGGPEAPAQESPGDGQSVIGIPEIGGYRIKSLLGTGGNGRVYLAGEEQTGRQVALKTMIPEIAADVEHKARFIRETKSMQNLRHPNIVPILDSGYSRGLFYFTLEYCNGGNLEGLLGSKPGGLQPDEAVRLVNDVLDGLDYLHNVNVGRTLEEHGAEGSFTGLIHRDIKPENILINKTVAGETVKIADFGLAKAFNLSGLHGLTRTGAVGGTLAFVCRQQIVNYKHARPEVDVWSSAAVLYYLLAGHPPRDMRQIRNPMCAVLESDPVPIRKRNPRISKRLADLLDSALDDRKMLKFKTAKDLKNALEACR
ncbi:MAG: protein kinase [Victivallales bacterium]|nr:protein kinase [Victivallales bacterium]